MKVSLIIILVLTMMVCGTVVLGNMLSNPDFLVDAEGWSIDSTYGSLSVAGPGIVGNVLFAKIDSVGANSWEPELHSPTFDLVNGKTYTYAFWAKTEPGATRDLSCSFEQLDTWVGIGETITVNDQWVDYHFTGEWTDSSSPPQVVIHIGFEFMLEDVWFSHFRVYEGDYVEEDLASVTSMDRLTTAWGRIKSE